MASARDEHLADLEHVGPVGALQGLGGVLLDEQDRGALAVDLGDDVEDLGDQHRRQAHRRLVEEEHLGLGHQRPADGEHLLLAAREGAAGLALALEEPGEQLEDPLELAGVVLAARGRRCPCRGSPSRSCPGRSPRPSGAWQMPRSTSLWGAMPVMSSPSKVMRPAVTAAPRRSSSAWWSCPAPLAPMSVTISPSSTASDTPAERLDLAVVDVDVVELKQHRMAPPGRPG